MQEQKRERSWVEVINTGNGKIRQSLSAVSCFVSRLPPILSA